MAGAWRWTKNTDLSNFSVVNLKALKSEEVTGTQTFYEKQYLEVDKAITYIKFRLK